MINDYTLLNQTFKFELHDDSELTSDLIRKYGCNVDMESVYAYNFLLKEGDIFFDVGANIGWTTLFGSRAVGKTGKVFSFEPEKKNVHVLKNNVNLNKLNNVEVIEKALSNEESIGYLYQSNNNYGNHILNPLYYQTDVHSQQSEVEVTTIDKFIQYFSIDPSKISLMKVDVEGSEPRVFNGGSEFFKNYRPNIIFEYSPFHIKQCGSSPFDILSFIDRHNYVPFLIKEIDLDNPKYELQPISVMDMIALTKNLMDRCAYKDILLCKS